MKWGLFKCLNEERKFKNRNLKKLILHSKIPRLKILLFRLSMNITTMDNLSCSIKIQNY